MIYQSEESSYHTEELVVPYYHEKSSHTARVNYFKTRFWVLSMSMSSLDVSRAAVLALAAASAAMRRNCCEASLCAESALETLDDDTSVPLS